MSNESNLLYIQKTKMNIIDYLEQDEELDSDLISIDDIIFYPIVLTDEEATENQLTSFYQFIEFYSSKKNYDKYCLLIQKFINNTNFLELVFNDEITAEEFITITQVRQFDSKKLDDVDALIDFITENIDLLKPFKIITLNKYNLQIILTYISILLVQCQWLTYQEMLDNKDILNEIYTDAGFFINQKSNFGLI